jgi:hypothetical protein
MRKKTDSYWQVHAAGVGAFSEQSTLLIVEPSRRSGSPCQTIKGDLVEYLVSTDCFFWITEISGAGASCQPYSPIILTRTRFFFGRRIRRRKFVPTVRNPVCFGNCDDNFATHDLTFKVGVGVVFAGAIVSIGAGRRVWS